MKKLNLRSDTIVVYEVPYRIIIVDTLDDDGNDGIVRHSKQTITITYTGEQGEDYLNYVLYHEVAHIISFMACLGLGEKKCDRLARVLKNIFGKFITLDEGVR